MAILSVTCVLEVVFDLFRDMVVLEGLEAAHSHVISRRCLWLLVKPFGDMIQVLHWIRKVRVIRTATISVLRLLLLLTLLRRAAASTRASLHRSLLGRNRPVISIVSLALSILHFLAWDVIVRFIYHC